VHGVVVRAARVGGVHVQPLLLGFFTDLVLVACSSLLRLFSTSSPTYPAWVSAVASLSTSGTFTRRRKKKQR